MDSCDNKKPVFFGCRISWQDQSGFLFPPIFEGVEFRLHSFASEILTVKICCFLRFFATTESCFNLDGDTNGRAAIELEAENRKRGGEREVTQD
jgi:hypothetical protein